jgi:hypothetical protein
VVTGAFGTLLIVLAVATVVSVEPELRWPGAAVAAVLAILGVDAVIAAVRGQASIVSRIGPLP